MPATHFPKRAIHLDFHTMPGVYDVGRDFDPDEFADTLQRARVDYITVFAKCNLGFTYYPTRVGVPHPGLQRELLGPMIAACHARGIRVAAYFNTGLDHEQSVRHREWCKLNAKGQVYEMDSMGHFFRKMCLNTAYAEYTLSMIGEVLDAYPVDGIFLDCFTLTPCYGGECVDGMRALGMDPFDEQQAQAYTWRVTQEFTEQVDRLVQEKRPGIYVYYNGLPYHTEPTHVELEILPTGGWGYDYLPWNIRYARTLDRPYFTMTGRFHKSWGDFGGLRPLHALLFDCYNSLANGGTCSVGDHMHPRGRLEPAVYDVIGQVYERVQALEPWTEAARPLAEIAVVEPTLRHMRLGGLHRASVAGAARMLMELKQQFDVCDGEGDLSGYQVLVLPDDVPLTPALQQKVRAHLARGGALISSAYAGLDETRSGLALDAYGVVYQGPEPHDPTFVQVGPEISQDMPDMPITIYRPGIAMQAKAGATVLARLIQPYFNARAWDWRHENMYMPPEQDSGRPALVQAGNVYHFSFPLFQGYYHDGVLAYRTLLGNCLARAMANPLVRTGNLPSFGQVTVTQQETRHMVHLLTYVPELRGEKAQLIEEPISVRDVTVALRCDGRQVREVYLAPGRQPLPFQREGDYVMVTVPVVEGYQMVVFEEA